MGGGSILELGGGGEGLYLSWGVGGGGSILELGGGGEGPYLSWGEGGGSVGVYSVVLILMYSIETKFLHFFPTRLIRFRKNLETTFL